MNQAPRDARRLRELGWLFLKLGTTAFGGPAAHIALMEEECVRRRQWLTHEEFLDLLGAANLIPGPNSTEMAIHIGYKRGGWPGLLLAGSAFIIPAALMVTACAWAYQRYGAMPAVEHVMYGVKPVVIAVVAQALWGLGKAALKTRALVALAVIAAVASFAGANEIVLLLGAGLAAAAWIRPSAKAWATAGAATAGSGALAHWSQAASAVGLSAAAAATPGGLFLVFAKIGSVLFGSGYVLLAFLRADLVERLHWLSETQLLDAIAVGQVTPGPVFTTATFVGYLVAGGAGALAATLGIFLPAFVFVAISGPFIPRLRRSPVAGAFMDGVNVASWALMAVVTAQLLGHAVVDATTLLITVGAAWLLIRRKVNAMWLVLAGAAIGFALHGVAIVSFR